LKEQVQPTLAVGIVRTPVDDAHPVPIVIVNAAVPLLLLIDGDVQNPELIVGAVALHAIFVANL